MCGIILNLAFYLIIKNILLINNNEWIIIIISSLRGTLKTTDGGRVVDARLKLFQRLLAIPNDQSGVSLISQMNYI